MTNDVKMEKSIKLIIHAIKDIKKILEDTDKKLEKIKEDKETKEAKDWLERLKTDCGKVKSTEVFLRTIINKKYSKHGLDCYSGGKMS